MTGIRIMLSKIMWFNCSKDDLYAEMTNIPVEKYFYIVGTLKPLNCGNSKTNLTTTEGVPVLRQCGDEMHLWG